jgi:3-phosphoshikimate 1-carboxyvinyltransferase
MALPELIEIVPPAAPAPAVITVPGSKSITNRALILAALAQGVTTLRGALWSEDTEIMVEALRHLGFSVEVKPEADEASNCTLRVEGLGGRIPRAGTEEQPLQLYVGNAGTAARFLMALVCLGRGVYRLVGTARMSERPQTALVAALRQLGYRVESAGGGIPLTIHGEGPRAGACRVSIEESSQFASALLLSSRVGGWRVEVEGEDAEESAYVAMTLRLLEAFPGDGGDFQIEPDASSASYFLAAGALLPQTRLEVAHWPDSGWQIDARFRDFARCLAEDSAGPAVVSRLHDLGDAIMTAIVLAPLLERPVRFTDLGRLRLQECERVYALRTELTKCGARVIEEGDSLEVFPSRLHGAEIETYDDHRMAMCFATLGLRVPGMRLRGPDCVKKTFPNFFQKLACPAPAGLGASILDAGTGRQLALEELLAQ